MRVRKASRKEIILTVRDILLLADQICVICVICGLITHPISCPTDFTDFVCMAPVLTIRVIRGFFPYPLFLSHGFHRFHRYCLYSPVLTIRVLRVFLLTLHFVPQISQILSVWPLSRLSHPLSLLPPLSPWRGAGGEAFLPLPLERGRG